MSAAAAAADSALERIERDQLVAIVRVDGPDTAVEAVRGLLRGGIGVAEISLTTPRALAALERCALLEGDLLLGAGTSAQCGPGPRRGVRRRALSRLTDA